jgi:hypothetical protein
MIDDRRLQCAANKQFSQQQCSFVQNQFVAASTFAPFGFGHLAFVGGARVIWHREEEIDPSAVRDGSHQRRAFSIWGSAISNRSSEAFSGDRHLITDTWTCRRSLTASSSDWSYEANWSF